MTRRLRELGAVYAYARHDGGSAYTLERGEYGRLLADWMAGKAFFTGVAFYGSTITLKLGDIVAIVDQTPAAMHAARADGDADKAEDAIL